MRQGNEFSHLLQLGRKAGITTGRLVIATNPFTIMWRPHTDTDGLYLNSLSHVSENIEG